MKKVIAILAVAMFSLAALPSYSADEAAPAAAPVKATGAAGAKEPGRTGDPASAEKKKKGAPTGGQVKSTGAAVKNRAVPAIRPLPRRRSSTSMGKGIAGGDALPFSVSYPLLLSDRLQKFDQRLAVRLRHAAECLARGLRLTAVPEDRLGDVACAAIRAAGQCCR